jgi:hypothetical protein
MVTDERGGSGAGSSSVSQKNGFGAGSVPKCHGSATLLITYRVQLAGAGECVREHEAGPARHPGGARQVPVQPAGHLLYLTCVPTFDKLQLRFHLPFRLRT